jgi:signal transduction histidine kinase
VMTRRRFGASHNAPGKPRRHTESDTFRPNGPNATRHPGSDRGRARGTSDPDGTGEPSRAGTRAHRARCCFLYSLRSTQGGFFAAPDGLARARAKQQSTPGCRSSERWCDFSATKVVAAPRSLGRPNYFHCRWNSATNILMPWCYRVCARRFARSPLLFAGVFFLVALAPPRPVAAAPPLLTNVQQVLDLGVEGARRSPRAARLRGVVTFAVEGSALAFFQDATGGIQVICSNAATVLLPGEFVELEGRAGGALIAPTLVDVQVRVLGTAPMPEPRRVPVTRLVAGDAYGQWVAIEGVVRDIAWNGGRRFLFISSGGLRFHTVMQPCADSVLPTNWIDARVDVRGVCSTDVNRENRPVGFTLYMPGTNDITFLRPKPSNPFGQPALSVKSDRQLRHQSDDRMKVTGTVLFHSAAGTVYLRTDSGPVEARLLVPLARAGPKGHYLDRQALPLLPPGTQVELIGAPTDAMFAPVLQDAELRVIGNEPSPTALVTSETGLLSGEHDRDLVAVRARLLAHATRESGASRHDALVLQIGDTVLEAVPALGPSNGLPVLPQDCYVEAVGVCLVQPGEFKRSIRLLLRNPSELRVVGQWSAWRSPEAAKIAGVAATLGLAAVGWIWSLRRRVNQGTAELALANRSLRSEVEERKRAEAELARALNAEKELSRLKSRFVSIVSHEFRTPLGIIMSSADILRKYTDRLAPERRAEHLQEIHDATRHMAGMMEQALLLGRVESGGLAFTPAQLDLRSLCEKLADEQRSASHGRCPIVVRVADFGGPPRGDEALLRHIFSNLLSNAVKYSPKGSTVNFTVERAAADAVFVVRDCGIGIPTAEGTRLFTAFHRCANVGEVPGTGLGLLIVKRCVELHGGSITFESQEGAGTVFTVRLPLFRTVEPAQV